MSSAQFSAELKITLDAYSDNKKHNLELYREASIMLDYVAYKLDNIEAKEIRQNYMS